MKNRSKTSKSTVLPKPLLKNYSEASFSLQLKSKFFYSLSISAISFTAILIIYGFISNLLEITKNPSYYQILTGELFLLVLLLFSFYLLLKGRYFISINLLLIATFVTVWFVIFIDEGAAIARVDTLFFTFALFTMLPLVIPKRLFIIPIYLFLNLVGYLLFSIYFAHDLFPSGDIIIEFLGDAIIALFFTTLVVYNVNRINRQVLEKTEADLLDKNKTEQALIHSEAKYSQMAELLPQSIFESNLKGNITYINKNAQDTFGYSFADIEKGINIFSVIKKEDHERLKKNIDNVMLGNKNKGNVYTAIKKNSTTFPIEIYSTTIIENQHPVGIRGVIIDITERVKTNVELKASEEKYRTIMENMNEVVMYVDHNDKVKYVNKKFTELLGYLPDEIIGKIGYKTLLDPKDHSIIQDANLDRLKNKKGQYELTFLGKNGQKIDFLISGTPLKDSKGKLIGSIGSMTDITDRKKIEKELEAYRSNLELLVKERTEELEAMNEELIATNDELYNQREELQATLKELHHTQSQLIESDKMASLGLLSAGVAHEINNPLNFIQGGVFGIMQYLHENLENHLPKITPLTDSIQLGVERVVNIVTSLNHFSRQSQEFNEKFDIHNVVDNCLTMLQNQLKNKIEVTKKYYPTPLIVIGNEGKLHQAILNILTNALQAIQEKGEITVLTKISKTGAKINIQDNGSGIKADNLKKIFDPFFTTKDPGKGTGLGLSITYTIIKDHKGTIEYQSKLGEGTSVRITLPLAEFKIDEVK